MALETYLLQKFTEHGITASSGKYSDLEGKEKECDFIVQGTQVIVLIEVKKKQLTQRQWPAIWQAYSWI
jgi:hypothetical protein